MELPVALTGYELALWIHITAVVVGLGTTFAESVLFPVAMKMDARHLPYVHKLQLTINRYFASPALLVILITGIYLVNEANWDFGSFWVSASFLIVLILGAINGAYFIPVDKRLEAMLEEEIAAAGPGEFTPSEDYMNQARIEGILGAFTGVLIIIAIFMMVAKPGA